jgi:DNA polymerase-3 subunit delta'
VNQDLKNQLDELSLATSSTDTISKLEAMSEARVRIGANVRDLMVLESLAIQLRRKV